MDCVHTRHTFSVILADFAVYNSFSKLIYSDATLPVTFMASFVDDVTSDPALVKIQAPGPAEICPK